MRGQSISATKRLRDFIPGLAAAEDRERTVREASFLAVNESIAGFEVLPMTLTHLMILRAMDCPLLYRGAEAPTAGQLAAFLWVLSPDYGPRNTRARKVCLKRFRALIPLPSPILNFGPIRRHWEKQTASRLIRLAELIHAARSYIDETFQDRPASAATVNETVEYYSDAASFCALLGREYGWPESEVLRIPLKRLFQYLKEIASHHDARAVLFNPSDRVKGDWLQSLSRQPSTINGLQ